MMSGVKHLVWMVAVHGVIQLVSGAIGGTFPKGLEGTYFVQLDKGSNDARQCAGTLVDRRWVGTGAMCVEANDWDVLSVVINSQKIVVDRVVIHPNFTGWFDNGIALLHLQEPAKVGDPNINSVDGIPTQEIEDTIMEKGRRCYYVSKGVSRTENGIYKDSEVLKKVAIRFTKTCKNSLRGFTAQDRYKGHFTCFRSVHRGDTSCEDFGAAIMCRHQGKWYPTAMVGIYDVRNRCRMSYMVAVNVAHYRNWIMSVIES